MEIVKYPLEKLHPLPGNSRIHDEHQIQFLRGRLRKRGQRRALLVNLKPVRGVAPVIIVGNGLYEAMKREGWKECDVELHDWSEQEAIEEAEADNRAYELGAVDFNARRENLLELDSFNFDLNLTGFTPVELEDIMTWTPDDANNQVQEEEIRYYKKTHILISFPPEKLIEIQPFLESIMNVGDVEIEQASNG